MGPLDDKISYVIIIMIAYKATTNFNVLQENLTLKLMIIHDYRNLLITHSLNHLLNILLHLSHSQSNTLFNKKL